MPGKQIVMALVARNGRVRSFHIPNVTAATLHPILGVHAHRDSRLMTDEARAVLALVGAKGKRLTCRTASGNWTAPLPF